MSNTSYVTAAKPNVDGAVFSAPPGTALPKKAKVKINTAFKTLGYISEDGLTNENSPESEVIKAWGGDVVNTVVTEKSDTFSYTLIEALNVEVLKEVYGADNVTGDLETGIIIKSNAKELPEHPLIIDVLHKNKFMRRIVIPRGKVKEIGEIVYKDGENVSYKLTVQALPDEEGNAHYEYIEPIEQPAGGTD